MIRTHFKNSFASSLRAPSVVEGRGNLVVRPLLKVLQKEVQETWAKFFTEPSAAEAFERFLHLFIRALKSGKRVFICGNGGSMAEAMHFAEEWTGKFNERRRPYPVMAFSDPAALTCIANDFGYEQVFSRQVEAFARTGDLLVVLSTSGNSPNIIEAARLARKKKVTAVCLLGRDGGKVKRLCETAIVVPSESTARIQEIHLFILHAVTALAEEVLL